MSICTLYHSEKDIALLKKQKIMFEELKMLGIEPQQITFIRVDKTEETIDSFNLLTTTNAGKLVKKNSAQRN